MRWTRWVAAGVLALIGGGLRAQGERGEWAHQAPVRLHGGGQAIEVESPGYASPCWADVTGDGKPDLLVGQFKDGKIRVYPGLGKGKLGPGRWLMAGGEVAQVPGVW